MIGNETITGILDSVVLELSGMETVMKHENKTIWGDFIDHIINGSSMIEDMLFDCVDSCIWIQLEKLKPEDLEDLWWDTEPGKDLSFELEWAQQHHPEQVDEFKTPPVEEMIQDLVVFCRNKLALRAEREWMEKEEDR